MEKLFLPTVLVFSILVAQAYALGIATDYGSDVIELPITQKVAYYSFRLQNMENKSKTVMIYASGRGGIIPALLNKTEYTLQPMTRSVEFLVELLIPEDARIGSSYEVSVDIVQVSDETGQVVLGQSIGKKFTVNIVSEESPIYIPLERGSEASSNGVVDYTSLIYIVGIVLPVGLIIAGCLWYRRRKKQMLEAQYPYGYSQ